MESATFLDADLMQMESMGIDESKIREQVRIFQKADSFIRLERPSTLMDGIQVIPESKWQEYIHLHQKAAEQGRFTKFVPASGAATRMFQSLIQIYHMPQYLEHDELHRRAEQGVSVASDFLKFLRHLGCFAFFDDLMDVLARNGLDLELLIRERRFRPLLEYLLMDSGLNYGSLPKALLKFHQYANGSRTSFEEHLVEAAGYLGNGDRVCHLHFTVSPEHEADFMKLFNRSRRCYEERFGVLYEVGFSFQKPSTNTIAVDMNNELFRDRRGQLVFRPAGHGALLENLNDLQGDLIYIKNIDNVVPDKLKGEGTKWKRILGGVLVEVQQRVHHLLRELSSEPSPNLIDEATQFARDRLAIQFPQPYRHWPDDRKAAYLRSRLNRPIRICGVVKNVGEPGGAPFWVRDKAGSLSLQIVEKAQVNLNDATQKNIWESSTHFNPVDLVCAVRDYEGKPFDLSRFVDRDAVFISKKSKDGRDLKALELPGLWNGSMSDWITVAVDVPRITFNPVKTVFDLLRPEHQSEPC